MSTFEDKMAALCLSEGGEKKLLLCTGEQKEKKGFISHFTVSSEIYHLGGEKNRVPPSSPDSISHMFEDLIK